MRLAAGLATTAVMAALATATMADESYIRVEAKRGAAADLAAAAWQAQFGDVVTWPLAGGMTAIALGPLDAQEAAERLARLKAEGTIPADSFIAAPATGTVVTALAAAGGADTAQTWDETAQGSAPANPAASASVAAVADSQPGAKVAGANEGADAAPDDADTDAADTADADATAPSYHVQLQAAPGEAAARRLLAQWQAQFPQAGLWQLPGGWYAIALPPEAFDAAEARRTALIRARRIPADAFLATSDRMGAVIEPPGAPAPLDAAADDGDAQPQPDAETTTPPDADAPADVAQGESEGDGEDEATPPAAETNAQAPAGAGPDVLASADPESPDSGDAEATSAGTDEQQADASASSEDGADPLAPAPPDEVASPLPDPAQGIAADGGTMAGDADGSPAGPEDAGDAGATPADGAGQPDTAEDSANQDREAADTDPLPGDMDEATDDTNATTGADSTSDASDSPSDDSAAEATSATPQPDTAGAASNTDDPAPADGAESAATASADATIKTQPTEAQEPVEMPPIREVQEALRWAGYYDGDIDGLTGPATKAAIAREIESVSPGADPARAMVNLLARREAWRADLGLWAMRDSATGITLNAPTSRLAFDRVERGMAIYGPRDGSGAALILVAREGDAAALAHFAGFITALGWVPDPQRRDERGRHVALEGADDDHYGQAQLWLENGVIQGFVLIWPADDTDNGRRLALEATESFHRDASIAPLEAPAPSPPQPANSG